MKSLFLVIFLFSSLVLGQQCSLPQYQTNGTLSGLTFCTFLNGQSVDFIWSTFGINIDTALSVAFQQIENYINNAASTHGFTPCQDCLDAIKTSLCLGMFGFPGYYRCILEKFYEYYRNTCPELCTFDSPCCFFCQDGTTTGCSPRTPSNTAQCVQNILSNPPNFVAFLDSCSSFLPDDRYCHDMVSVCSCGNNDGNALCSYYGWPQNGVVISSAPAAGAPCTWCSNKRELLDVYERASSQASFQINQHLTLGGVPVSSLSGGGAGINPASSVDNCVINPNDCQYTQLKESQNNSATSFLPSLFLILAIIALFL